MAAPLALLAGEKLASAVSNDLVVLNGRLYRTVRVGRKKVLEPVDVQVHVNPVSVGLGLLGGAVGLFAADLAWNGIHFGFPGLEFDLVKGLKDSPYWQGVVERLTVKKIQPPKNASCGELQALESALRAANQLASADAIRAKAKAQGCAWAGGYVQPSAGPAKPQETFPALTNRPGTTGRRLGPPLQ